jgi:hypothetical protein
MQGGQIARSFSKGRWSAYNIVVRSFYEYGWELTPFISENKIWWYKNFNVVILTWSLEFHGFLSTCSALSIFLVAWSPDSITNEVKILQCVCNAVKMICTICNFSCHFLNLHTWKAQKIFPSEGKYSRAPEAFVTGECNNVSGWM